MTYDPCNPTPQIIHHQVIGRFKHRGRIGGHHHAAHHVPHVAGCTISVLDQKRFGALPKLASLLKAIAPVIVVAGTIGGAAAVGATYWGGGYYGGSGGSGSHFVCTKESHDKRCQHVVQVPEPNPLAIFVPAVLFVFLRKRKQ